MNVSFSGRLVSTMVRVNGTQEEFVRQKQHDYQSNTTIKATGQGMTLEDATLLGLKMEEGHEPKKVGGLWKLERARKWNLPKPQSW